jgi:hypothetical protein
MKTLKILAFATMMTLAGNAFAGTSVTGLLNWIKAEQNGNSDSALVELKKDVSRPGEFLMPGDFLIGPHENFYMSTREISSGTIAGLRGQEAQLTAQEAFLAKSHGDQYPELQRVRAQLQDVRGQIARQTARDRTAARQMARDRTAALQTVERSRAREQDSAPCFVFEVRSLSGSTGKYAISSSDGNYIEEKGILYMAYRLNDIVTFLDAGQQLSDCDNVERATVCTGKAEAVCTCIASALSAEMLAGGGMPDWLAAQLRERYNEMIAAQPNPNGSPNDRHLYQIVSNCFAR